MVLLFHLFRNAPQTALLAGTLPLPIQFISDYSRSGVAIFFVISGFVIAHTTRGLGADWREAGRFIARRQVRLDPPYYAMVVLVLIAEFVERRIPGLVYQTRSLRDVAANFAYLQGFVGASPVLGVAWTLCLEVQFYLVVVLIRLVAGHRAPARWSGSSRVRLMVTALTVLSALLPFSGIETGAWFIGTWWMFGLGMLVYWATVGELSTLSIAAALATVTVSQMLPQLLQGSAGDRDWPEFR